MLASGFILLKEYKENSIFVFKADNTLVFSLGEDSYVFSDTLSF